MQIVIKLPDEIMKSIFDGEYCGIIDKRVYDAIKCGTPLPEQQSKTVLYRGDGYADGCMVYDMAECPNCGYEYEDGDKDLGLPFCPGCGQSLIWESKEVLRDEK